MSRIDEALYTQAELRHRIMEDQIAHVTADVVRERNAQLDKWGPQTHPDGTGKSAGYIEWLGFWLFPEIADMARDACDARARLGIGTWADILLEETFEAMAEDDPIKLRKELIQVIAVATAWVEDIDRKGAL